MSYCEGVKTATYFLILLPLREGKHFSSHRFEASLQLLQLIEYRENDMRSGLGIALLQKDWQLSLWFPRVMNHHVRSVIILP